MSDGFFKKTDDETEKSNATFYLFRETQDELDRVWLQLRERKYSKSQIVDAAIRMALADFDERGDGSALMSWLPISD